MISCQTTIKEHPSLNGYTYTVHHGPNPEAILELDMNDLSEDHWEQQIKLAHWLHTVHQRCCNNPNVFFKVYYDGSIKCWEQESGGFGVELENS